MRGAGSRPWPARLEHLGAMNIIILGAGRVGESVAENLVSEKNDITVIDKNPKAFENKVHIKFF